MGRCYRQRLFEGMCELGNDNLDVCLEAASVFMQKSFRDFSVLVQACTSHTS